MRRRSPSRATRARFTRAGVLVCAIALGSSSTACGGKEHSTSEPSPKSAEPSAGALGAAPPAAAVPGGSAAAPDAIVKEGEVPADFPSDVPIYPGATIGSSLTTKGLGVFATFESNDSVEAVISHYRAELGKSGWRVDNAAEGGGLDGAKGDRSVQVRVRRNEANRTEIAINVMSS